MSILYIYILPLHVVLPICVADFLRLRRRVLRTRERCCLLLLAPLPQLEQLLQPEPERTHRLPPAARAASAITCSRSEEHTSELQSRENFVCSLMLEKKKLK